MTTLFHYTSLPTFLAIVESQSIRFCELSKSNDLTEGTFILESLRGLMKHAGMPNQIQTCVSHSLERLIGIYSYFGFCLTSEGDDLGQWRAYANDGQGVAIGFNLEKLAQAARKSSLGSSTKVTKVAYGKEFILPSAEVLFIVLRKLEEKMPQIFWSKPEELFRSDGAGAKEFQQAIAIFSDACYNVKNPSFSLERETRITQETVFTASKFLKFFARQGRIVPYYSIEIAPDCIDCIVAGPQLDVSPCDISRVLSSWSSDLIATKVYRSVSSARK